MTPGETAAHDWLTSRHHEAMARLELLVNALVDENARQNLVSRPSLEAVWQRHILDSAQLLHVSRETVPSGSWLDLGSGAGFPGLVIAALQPERPVALVDSRRLRTEWLVRAAAHMGLANVEVILSRVEDLPDRRWSVISARAFAPLDRLLDVAARFSTPETLWLLPKGARAQHELNELGADWNRVFHVEQSLTDPSAGIIVGHLIGRTDKTPSRKRGSRR
ncbi:16S rRNA (guanine(527)-N(7))-methyltransferase RsmG [Novosphingobium fuchskuhlense]|uniref:Ribosomal RNA small subunit methyltransferase G n=1 Tax=Novosphingobium fuchskuhlense TaxID=1117702 RepID=A0A117UWQ0_9SPHN|nr:16S rRNA (guanine(527)-N(7))-methyltransferase RsmG [Novosphingobium fuchskuhlense]KUR72271.1 16S rRNA (guanine(527)-N(7))-methyltransferase RsmG [Novosphingobium fuchskuhlense]